MAQAVFFIILIYVVIAGIWGSAEKLIYGKITQRKLDDIIAVILAISLYFNIF